MALWHVNFIPALTGSDFLLTNLKRILGAHESSKDAKYLCWALLKGCGMGPLLVLVSHCFRKNVVGTCKIGSFLCSSDNFLQKNVIFFFFWKSNFKMVLIWKRGYIFDLLLIFFSYQGKLEKFLQHISHWHTYMYFAHPIDFFALSILEKKKLSGMVSL